MAQVLHRLYYMGSIKVVQWLGNSFIKFVPKGTEQEVFSGE